MHEPPLPSLAQREHVAKELLRILPRQEMSLIRRAFVGVSRGDRHTHVECGGEIEKRGDVRRRMVVEYCHIDVDGETLGFGGLDGRQGYVENTRLRDRLVMNVLQAIEMDREEEIGRGLEQMDLLLK